MKATMIIMLVLFTTVFYNAYGQGVEVRSTINSGSQIYTIGDYTLVSVIGQPLTGFNQGGRATLVNGAFKQTEGINERLDTENGFALKSIFPNPADEKITIEFTLAEVSDVSYQLVGIDGKIALTTYLEQVAAGSNSIELDVSSIQRGIYQLVLQTESASVSERIVIVRN